MTDLTEEEEVSAEHTTNLREAVLHNREMALLKIDLFLKARRVILLLPTHLRSVHRKFEMSF